MAYLGRESSGQSFREKLLENNKLLVGSAAVLLITSFAASGLITGIASSRVDNYKAPETSKTVVANTNNSNTSNTNQSTQKAIMSAEAQAMAETTCTELNSMGVDAVDFTNKLYDAGFRRTADGENQGDELTNMTTALFRGCEKNPTSRVGDYVSIKADSYEGQYR